MGDAGDYLGCADSFSDGQVLSFKILDAVSATIGLTGAAFVVNHYLLYSRGLILSRLIFLLSLADLGATFFMVFSSLWILIDEDSYNKVTCSVMRSFIQVFIPASWLITSLIAFYLYRAIVGKRDLFLSEGMADKRGKNKKNTYIFWALQMFCWGVPLAISIGLLASDNYKKVDGGWCEPKRPYQYIVWDFFLFIAFVWNAFFYTLISFCMVYRHKKFGRGIKTGYCFRMQGRLTLFLLVYIVCWLPSLISHLALLGDCKIFWILILKNCLAPSQGFFNCIVYSLSNRQVRGMYKWYMIPFAVLVSPFMVIPIMVLAFVQYLTCGRISILRKKTGYISSQNNGSWRSIPNVNDDLGDIDDIDVDLSLVPSSSSDEDVDVFVESGIVS